ncbi:amidohydrolase family protein [Geopsychrobacter electrodiphilus]|uniref:amidohydrolase family protein n=1 Tax=Geopsychrobacter electrodiphilus TaxID=225196 RepID=UPI00037D3CB2|nr:amidohydrolase family protein [Geopsychrobacter electrodiphilus]
MAMIYTAQYLVCNSSQTLEAGALLEDRGRIIEVGAFSLLKKAHPSATVIDYGDRVILPAFINAHTHLELSHYPESARAAGVSTEPCDFVDWVLRLISVKRSLPPNAMTAAIETGLRLSLAAGTGAVGDILSWYEGRSAYLQSPMSGRIYLESLGQDLYVTRQQFKKLSSVLKEKRVGKLELGVSPHSPYTIRPEYMRQLFQVCRAESLGCSTHIAESGAEVDFLADGTGAIVDSLYPAVNWHQYAPRARQISPVGFIAEQGGLFKNQLLVHGVQLKADEIAAIAEAHASLVLCPRSNAHLQVGVAPAAKLKQAGVRLALGTDSLASNQSLSLWDELAFAAEVYADAFDAAELFALATTGGASALGLTDQLGALNPGLCCSFQVVQPQVGIRGSKVLESLVCAGNGQQVYALVLDGKVVKLS